MMKKVIAGSLMIVLFAGAANAMPSQRVVYSHNKPGAVAQKTMGPAVRRPTVTPRQQVVVVRNVQNRPYYNYNQGCNHGCNSCNNHSHGGSGSGLLTAMTVGLVTGGVLYALAK